MKKQRHNILSNFLFAELYINTFKKLRMKILFIGFTMLEIDEINSKPQLTLRITVSNM